MAHAVTVGHQEAEEHSTTTGLDNRKMLMWVFLGSDVMFFGAFIATYLVYRDRSLVGPYPNTILDIPLTTLSTFVLLMSSLAMVLALYYVQHDRPGLGRLWILVTAGLGTIFIGFQVYEFNHFVHLGLTPRTNLFGTTFFVLTGFHGAHVTLGILWLLGMAWASSKGALTSKNALNLEIAGLYWHFVDIVWIV
ncbi:MAG: cytochrome c oxidase subunit 3, partial [Dehalococcoidia bacterium]